MLVVEEGDRAVLHLVYDGRVGGADERGVHLVRRRGERAADDFRGDRVERPDRHQLSTPTKIERWPKSSTWRVEPGGTTVVAVASTITAGPSTTAPGTSASRRTMRALRSRRPKTIGRSSYS